MDGVTLNGVIPLGQSMDMSGGAGDDGRYINTLPTLAAFISDDVRAMVTHQW